MGRSGRPREKAADPQSRDRFRHGYHPAEIPQSREAEIWSLGGRVVERVVVRKMSVVDAQWHLSRVGLSLYETLCRVWKGVKQKGKSYVLPLLTLCHYYVHDQVMRSWLESRVNALRYSELGRRSCGEGGSAIFDLGIHPFCTVYLDITKDLRYMTII